MTDAATDPPAPSPAQELAQLLARVSLGDRRAFEAFYRRTSAQAFGASGSSHSAST